MLYSAHINNGRECAGYFSRVGINRMLCDVYSWIFCFILSSWDRVSLCSLGCPGIHSVNQACLCLPSARIKGVRHLQVIFCRIILTGACPVVGVLYWVRVSCFSPGWVELLYFKVVYSILKLVFCTESHLFKNYLLVLFVCFYVFWCRPQCVWRLRYVGFLFYWDWVSFCSPGTYVDQGASFRELKGARLLLNLDVVGLGFKWNKRSYSLFFVSCFHYLNFPFVQWLFYSSELGFLKTCTKINISSSMLIL